MEASTTFNITNDFVVTLKDVIDDIKIKFVVNGHSVEMTSEQWSEFVRNVAAVNKEYYRRFHHQY